MKYRRISNEQIQCICSYRLNKRLRVVEAETEEDAIDKVAPDASAAGLCYSCSRKYDMGDIIEIMAEKIT